MTAGPSTKKMKSRWTVTSGHGQMRGSPARRHRPDACIAANGDVAVLTSSCKLGKGGEIIAIESVILIFGKQGKLKASQRAESVDGVVNYLSYDKDGTLWGISRVSRIRTQEARVLHHFAAGAKNIGRFYSRDELALDSNRGLLPAGPYGLSSYGVTAEDVYFYEAMSGNLLLFAKNGTGIKKKSLLGYLPQEVFGKAETKRQINKLVMSDQGEIFLEVSFLNLEIINKLNVSLKEKLARRVYKIKGDVFERIDLDDDCIMLLKGIDGAGNPDLVKVSFSEAESIPPGSLYR